MPCYLTGSAEGDARLDAAEARKEVTKLTRLLCEAMECLEHHGCDHISPAARSWWTAHKKVDAKRRSKKVIKKTCPHCGSQYPMVLASSIALTHKGFDFWICSANMPYQGCGYREPIERKKR